MKRKKIYLITVICLILSGCTTNSIIEKPEDNMEDNIITVISSDGEIIERSETISDIIVDLYGIDDATTIILNHSAIIGLKISYDQKLTADTIDIIESKVKDQDKYITEVLVTDKEKLFAEINNIVNELLQGKSYDSLIDEINKIKNKIN